MKYFLDSAKLDEIKFAYEHYCIDGVTTNPKHIKLSGKPFMQCVRDIAAWLRETGLEGTDFPVSFEINPHLDQWEEIVAAAKEVASYSKNYAIKIPCCEQGVIAAKKLEEQGVRTNVTLVFSPSQAIQAAKLGAEVRLPLRGLEGEQRRGRARIHLQDREDLPQLRLQDRDHCRRRAQRPSQIVGPTPRRARTSSPAGCRSTRTPSSIPSPPTASASSATRGTAP